MFHYTASRILSCSKTNCLYSITRAFYLFALVLSITFFIRIFSGGNFKDLCSYLPERSCGRPEKILITLAAMRLQNLSFFGTGWLARPVIPLMQELASSTIPITFAICTASVNFQRPFLPQPQDHSTTTFRPCKHFFIKNIKCFW